MRETEKYNPTHVCHYCNGSFLASLINLRHSIQPLHLMSLNMSSAPMETASSLTPRLFSSGRAGGGGPFFSGTGAILGAAFSFSEFSSTRPTNIALFRLPNQLPLFFRLRDGLLSTVEGLPGLSVAVLLRLSELLSVRRPRNLRTDDGRLPRLLWVGERGVGEMRPPSVGEFPLAAAASANVPTEGVGCEERGPLPGVGGRGVSGGESGGAGIEVPSVRLKLTGESCAC